MHLVRSFQFNTADRQRLGSSLSLCRHPSWRRSPAATLLEPYHPTHRTHVITVRLTFMAHEHRFPSTPHALTFNVHQQKHSPVSQRSHLRGCSAFALPCR